MAVAEKRRPDLRVGVLISAGGTTLENFIVRLRDGRLSGVRIGLVISSRAAVRGVDIARAADLPLAVIRPRDCAGDAAFSDAITTALDVAGVELALLAGFLSLWRVPAHWEGRALNIHPALLPRFGGRGMFGLQVHSAVLAAGESESGCTVHIVDREYDHGPIVAQARVPILVGDTPELLAARVGIAERELYPHVVQQIADHGVNWLRQFGGSRAGS